MIISVYDDEQEILRTGSDAAPEQQTVPKDAAELAKVPLTFSTCSASF